MKLSVWVLGREVAVLEPVGDFKSVLTYRPDTASSDFVSLTMPVRTQSWEWDDQLPPVFRMNLPEGYLLQILQEQFGPHIGASPTNLLSVIGRNMVGRIQVSAPGADLNELPSPIDVKDVLRGDNSEAAFAELVRQHARSGVSGIQPKFLDEEQEVPSGRKATLFTRRHIIKGSSNRLPFVALNEHFAMQVAAQVVNTAHTEISDDGRALVVHRFDVDQEGHPHRGLEDFCALLGLRPENKYETTWERIANAVRDFVPGEHQRTAFQHLTATLLLTYALRNSDCHSKNVALLYTSRADVMTAPVYDMLTTTAYPDYENNPPGIMFGGKRTWLPGKNLKNFIAGTFGIEVREQKELVEKISDAVSKTAHRVRAAMNEKPEFRDVGKRMLQAWKAGVRDLRNERTFALGRWTSGSAFEGFSDAPMQEQADLDRVGPSPLLAKRRRARKK